MEDRNVKRDFKSVRESSKKMILSKLQLPPSTSVDISFENISYSVSESLFSSKRKEILKGVSGCFKSGELTAIMGPSGAGKSSLLNVLSGFVKDGVKGSLYANGQLVDAKRSQTKSQSAYIMQDDHLSPLFTVNETMIHAANVKLGYSTSYKSKILLIEDILDSMAMREAQNTRCGRLSGGQKKRLCVCLEIINNPSIIYLDEPTSGLDSLSCSLLVNKLKGLSRTGRTVICTIHQPSATIFDMFDHLYLVSSGKAVYKGDPSNIVPFLEYSGFSCPMYHNPADFVMDVLTGEFGDHNDKLLSATENNNWRTEESNVISESECEVQISRNNSSTNFSDQSPPEWFRYFHLIWRMIRQIHRDWTLSYLKIVLNALVGISVGLLFLKYGNNGFKVYGNISFNYVSITYISFTSMMPAAIEFSNEILVLKKEHFNNWYKFRTYFFAFLTVHAPITLLLTLIYGSISYVMTGQQLELFRFVIFMTGLAFSAVQAELIGLFMGTSANPVNGMFNGSIFVAAMSLLGGFYVLLKDMPLTLYYITYTSYYRYLFEIMVLSFYGFGRPILDCPSNVMYCHQKFPKIILNDFSMNDNNLWMDILILTGFIVFTVIITFYRLRYRVKSFQ